MVFQVYVPPLNTSDTLGLHMFYNFLFSKFPELVFFCAGNYMYIIYNYYNMKILGYLDIKLDSASTAVTEFFILLCIM